MYPSIVEKLFENCKKHPEKIAVIDGDITIDYATLQRKIIDTAARLTKLGIAKSSIVAFSAEKSAIFPQMYFSIHAIGAIAIPLDVSMNVEKVKEIFKIAQPDYAFLNDSQYFADSQNKKLETITELPSIKIHTFSFPGKNDVADIIFTTGTTSEPKGVMLTHKNILSGAVNTNQFIDNTSDDIEIIPLPLHHAFGLRRLRTNMLLGATVVLINGFMFADQILEAINKHGATGICMVPAGLSVLKRLAGDAMYKSFKNLKYIEFGSSSMKKETKEELVAKLPNVRLCMHYGLTEAAANIFTEFNQFKSKLDSLGKASPNIKIKITTPDNIKVKRGEIGEICVKGDVNMLGYINNEALTNEIKQGDWIKTKDLGYMDEEDFVFLTGRKDDIINVGGKKVAPLEIENALYKHPDIKGCACIGIQENNNMTGEIIKAFIVAKNQESVPDVKELIGFLRTQLEEYKIPKYFSFVKELPMTSSGKIKREMLKNN